MTNIPTVHDLKYTTCRRPIRYRGSIPPRWERTPILLYSTVVMETGPLKKTQWSDRTPPYYCMDYTGLCRIGQIHHPKADPSISFQQSWLFGDHITHSNTCKKYLIIHIMVNHQSQLFTYTGCCDHLSNTISGLICHPREGHCIVRTQPKAQIPS